MLSSTQENEIQAEKNGDEYGKALYKLMNNSMF